jgi:hypothetical protein
MSTKESRKPTKHPTLNNIYWAAGIYEGEGTCQSTRNCVGVHITQKDPWILHELQSLRARGFLYTIFPLLSPRRKEQAKKYLEIQQSERKG